MRNFGKSFIMFRESISMALDNIRNNKVRSFLTLLGIMIGVMAVITLITTVSGVTGSITSSFPDTGFIFPGLTTRSRPSVTAEENASAKRSRGIRPNASMSVCPMNLSVLASVFTPVPS